MPFEHCSKCCSLYCVISWLVLPIGIALLLHLIFKPCELHSDFIMWLLPLVAISYGLAWTLLFLILTIVKCKSKNCCCCILKFLWFVIHIGIFVAVIALNLHLVIHSQTNSQNLVNASAKSNKLPSWFITMQNTKNCCGINGPEDYGKILGPKELISSCESNNNSALGNSSKLNTSSTGSNWNCSVAVPGCKSYLNKLYRDCPETRITYCIVMLILGLIPFVTCANSGNNINQVQDEEQANEKNKDRQSSIDKSTVVDKVTNEDEEAKKETAAEADADKENKNPELTNSQGETTNVKTEVEKKGEDVNINQESSKPVATADHPKQDLKVQNPAPEAEAVPTVHQNNPTVQIPPKAGENQVNNEPQLQLPKNHPTKNDLERRPSFLVQESNKLKANPKKSLTNANGSRLKIGSNLSIQKKTPKLSGTKK